MAKAHPRTKRVNEDELHEIIEALGLWFEEAGVPRMAGRVVGWLLVCEPPEQTMQELAESLNASMGSISTMTRFLAQMGLIERTSIPGERRIRYRVRPDAWSWTIEERMAHIDAFLEIGERALRVLEDADPVRRERIELIASGIRSYESELAAIVAKWRNHPAEGAAS